MFDMDNSFKLGGASILDAGSTGIEANDVPIKRYVDRWHNPKDSQDNHYQRYIKSRVYTMLPLTGLCKVTTTIPSSGNIPTLLGTSSRSNSFYFTPNHSPVKDKNIQVTYQQSVWVEEWIFVTLLREPLSVAFKWQASDDETTWVDIGTARITSTGVPPSMKAISLNAGQWNFINPESLDTNKRYSYWRLKGVSGGLPSATFVNIMHMYLI